MTCPHCKSECKTTPDFLTYCSKCRSLVVPLELYAYKKYVKGPTFSKKKSRVEDLDLGQEFLEENQE